MRTACTSAAMVFASVIVCGVQAGRGRAQNLVDQPLRTERQPDLSVGAGVQGKPGAGTRGELHDRPAMHQVEHHQIVIQQRAERHRLPCGVPQLEQRVAGDGDDLEVAARGFTQDHQLDADRVAAGAHVAPHETVAGQRAEMAVHGRFRRREGLRDRRQRDGRRLFGKVIEDAQCKVERAGVLRRRARSAPPRARTFRLAICPRRPAERFFGIARCSGIQNSVSNSETRRTIVLHQNRRRVSRLSRASAATACALRTCSNRETKRNFANSADGRRVPPRVNRVAFEPGAVCDPVVRRRLRHSGYLRGVQMEACRQKTRDIA